MNVIVKEQIKKEVDIITSSDDELLKQDMCEYIYLLYHVEALYKKRTPNINVSHIKKYKNDIDIKTIFLLNDNSRHLCRVVLLRICDLFPPNNINDMNEYFKIKCDDEVYDDEECNDYKIYEDELRYEYEDDLCDYDLCEDDLCDNKSCDCEVRSENKSCDVM